MKLELMLIVKTKWKPSTHVLANVNTLSFTLSTNGILKWDKYAIYRP